MRPNTPSPIFTEDRKPTETLRVSHIDGFLVTTSYYLVKSSPCQAVLDFGVMTTLPL
jgi:hypothetical protein